MADNTLTYNRFDSYSGSQVTVWFGDVWIDNINSIQWNRSQGKKPIYGYASQQFDAVAKGTVIVQGSFVINFKQTGYLSFVMNEIAKLYGAVATPGQYDAVRQAIGLHLRNGTFGPKTAQELQDLANSPDFMAMANAYEDVIWGESPTNKGLIQSDGSVAYAKPYGVTAASMAADLYQNSLIPDGFNILLSYGNSSADTKQKLSDYMRSTVKTINNVHLVGESQVIQVGGQPTLEQYDFIARGTDEQLSSLL